MMFYLLRGFEEVVDDLAERSVPRPRHAHQRLLEQLGDKLLDDVIAQPDGSGGGGDIVLSVVATGAQLLVQRVRTRDEHFRRAQQPRQLLQAVTPTARDAAVAVIVTD